jgi:CHAT domain-containing protein
VEILKEMSSELGTLDFQGIETESSKKLEETKATSLKYLKRMAKDIDSGMVNPNFKHPYYWAPFGLVGNGGLYLE